MNRVNIGYRIKIDNFVENEEEIIKFLNYYNSLFNCSELKVTKKVLDSSILNSIIANYLNNQSYCNNFHIDKNYIYNYGSNMRENKLFSLLNGKKTNIITHLNNYKIDNDLYQNLRYISSEIPKGNNLLLENPDMSNNLFEYLFACEELSKKMNLDDIDNIGFCLDYGHILQFLFNSGMTFNSYYDYLIKQRNYLERVKEFHLHDFKSGNDHQVFESVNKNLIDFKKIYLNNPSNTIILENNVSDNASEIGVKQIKMIKRMLLNENQKN